MPTKTTTHGLSSLQVTLTKMGNNARKTTKKRVIVGFAAPYARAVHEMVEMKLQGQPRPSGRGVYWGPHGEAKFLERPARIYRRAIAQKIAQVTRSTHSPVRGMYSGGVFLRDMAKAHIPVEYGTLRDSAYIEVVG